MTTLQAALVRGLQERLEIVQRAVARVDVDVVGDVVPVVFERRRKERQQPETGDAQALQVVELLGAGHESRRCRRHCRRKTT